MNKNYYAVIMAGGVGSRFYPMSTRTRPKQFLDILGTGETLIQQTFRRLSDVVPQENIFVVTNVIYHDAVLEQLPALTDDRVLCEPLMRNTAPCIAYASYKIRSRNPEAVMVVAPSDHYITNDRAFSHDVLLLLEKAAQTDRLYTMGVRPTRPDTGYRYIQYVSDEDQAAPDDGIFRVKTFTEKPNLEIAKAFLESGDFLWNSGIFVWSVEAIVRAFKSFLPEMHLAFNDMSDAYYTELEPVLLNEIYAACRKESIDTGVMERASNVYVLPATFGWSDLGTWHSLYDKLVKDENANARLQGEIHTYDSRGNILCSDGLMLVKGLDNFIVASVGGVVVICPRDDEQFIKQMTSDVKAKGITLDI